MPNKKRIPFELNLDDPTDAALWEVLEPMTRVHRASSFIRQQLSSVVLGDSKSIRRAMPTMAIAQPIAMVASGKIPALDNASDNFMEMFS